MSTLFFITFTPAEIARQLRLNRVLARLPRLGVVGPFRRTLVRAVMRAGAIGADRRLRRLGLTVDWLKVNTGDRTTGIRIIRPPGRPAGIVFDIHGGAWAFGSPKVNDTPNSVLALTAGAIVVSIDYALALPRPISALQRECTAVLIWLLSRSIDELAVLPIVVTGESAGAHLVLGAMLATRDSGIAIDRICGMLLHCGAYDLGGSPSAMAADSDALVLHGSSLEAQMAILLGGLDSTQRRNPEISPLYADLAGLPRALIVVGDIDPLRDDSLLLAEAIARAGGTAELALIPWAPHAVIHLPGPYADRVRSDCAKWVLTCFSDIAGCATRT